MGAALLVTVCQAAEVPGAVRPPDAVLLASVKALTFHTGAWTTGRRSAPMPQLICEHSPDYKLNPTIVQCQNVGQSDTGEVQWKCEAELDPSVQFDQMAVTCEGYDYPDDPYVLVGSCALSYSLRRTPGWSAQQQQQQQHHYHQHAGHNRYEHDHHDVADMKGAHNHGLWSIIKIALFVFIAYKIIKCCCRRRRNQQPYPVPPVYPQPAAAYPNAPPPSYDQATSPSAPQMPPPMAPQPQSQPQPPPAPGFWRGWFWGSHLGSHHYHTTHVYHHDSGSRASGPSCSGSSFHSSSGTRTSTGFAGTKRR